MRLTHERGFLLVLFTLITLFPCCSRDRAERGQPVASSPTEQPQASLTADGEPGPSFGESFYGKVAALCIGINDYRSSGIDDLKWSVADAQAMADLFKQHYGYDVDTLIGAQATKSNVTDRLRQYAAGLGKEDALVVFFAGHGQTVELDRFGRTGFLIPYDARLRLDDTRDIDEWSSEAIDMRDIGALARSFNCRHVLFLIDACHSGFMGKRGVIGGRKDYQQLVKRNSRVVITAGTEDQTAFEVEDLQHGMFTHAILNELGASSATSATELFVNVRNTVSNLSNGQMLPQLREIVINNGEFVFMPKEVSRRAFEIAIAEINEQANERIARKTQLSHVFELMAVPNYRYAQDTISRARQWQRKLKRFEDNASLGDAMAMAGLHYCHSIGLGTDKSVAEAYKWAVRAYDTGEDIGEHVLGRCYLLGLGVEKNARAAGELFERAAQNGFPMSEVTMATRSLLGKPTQEDLRRAESWLIRAAKHDFPVAWWLLGQHYLTRPEAKGESELIERGLGLILKAANQDLAVAQYELYFIYSNDWWGTDLSAAERWLRRSAEAGIAEAQISLANELFRGLDQFGMTSPRLMLSANPREARSWAQLAADQEDLDAHLMMAYMCATGDGGPVDHESARRHCEVAVQHNHPAALAFQGRWYDTGSIYAPDPRKAIVAIRKSMGMGNAHGLFLFGLGCKEGGGAVIFGKGPIPSRKNAFAAHYYLLASKKGHTLAKDKLEELLPLDSATLKYVLEYYPESHSALKEMRPDNTK